MRKQGLIHDIMNIVTSIENRISLLKILQEKEETNGKIKENIQILSEKVPFLLDLLRQLRIEIHCEIASDNKITFVDINDIVHILIGILHDYPTRYEIEKSNFSRKGIYINKTNLERILTNLIANAVEASTENIIKIKFFEMNEENTCFFCGKKIFAKNEDFFCISIQNSGHFGCDYFIERFSTKESKYSGYGLAIVNELLHKTNSHMVLKKETDDVEIILTFA